MVKTFRMHTQQGGRFLQSQAQAGRRDDLGLYVRSKREANWARYLTLLAQQGIIRSWSYEPEVFWFHKFPTWRGGETSYRPDFLVVNPDGTQEYQEVKGWMDRRSKAKLKRMAKYYPDVRIEIVDTARYRQVERQWGSSIREWEW